MSAHYDATYCDRFFTTAYKVYRPLTNPLFLAFLGLLVFGTNVSGTFMQTDEAIWSYMARVWSENGIVPYSGTIDNKPPGIFLLYYVSHSLFGTNVWFPRAAEMLASFGTSLCLYWIIRRLANRTAGVIGMALYIGLMTRGAFHNATCTETFMIFFVALAFVLTIWSKNQQDQRYYLTIIAAGFSIGSAICFKQVAILDAIALLMFAAYFMRTRRGYKGVLQAFGLIFICIILTHGLYLMPLLTDGGSLTDYGKIAWVYLLGGREGEIGIIQRLANVGTAWRHNTLIIPYLGIAGFFLSRRSLQQFKIPTTLLLTWLALDFIGVNAAGTYYRHQYKQILLPLCIIFGIFFDYLSTQLGKKGRGPMPISTKEKIVLGIMLAVLIAYIAFGQSHYQACNRMFRQRRYNRRMELGLYIRQITNKDDYIYLFGRGQDPVLSYSDRQAPSAYFNDLFLSYPGAVEQVQRDMSEKTPLLVLLGRDHLDLRRRPKVPPPWLQHMVDTKYLKLDKKRTFDIFVLKTHFQEIQDRSEEVSFSR